MIWLCPSRPFKLLVRATDLEASSHNSQSRPICSSPNFSALPRTRRGTLIPTHSLYTDARASACSPFLRQGSPGRAAPGLISAPPRHPRPRGTWATRTSHVPDAPARGRRDPLVDAPTAAATCCTMGPAAPQHGGRAPGRCRPGPLRVSRPVVGARSFRILPVLHGANFVQSKGCGLLSGCVPEQTPVPSWKDRPRTAWARYLRGTCPA